MYILFYILSLIYFCRPICSELRSLERLSNASGNADTFEAVLAEEMHTMRESFEQKIASIKAQMERELCFPFVPHTGAMERQRSDLSCQDQISRSDPSCADQISRCLSIVLERWGRSDISCPGLHCEWAMFWWDSCGKNTSRCIELTHCCLPAVRWCRSTCMGIRADTQYIRRKVCAWSSVPLCM